MKPWHEMNEEEMFKHSKNLDRAIKKHKMTKTMEALERLGAGKAYGEK